MTLKPLSSAILLLMFALPMHGQNQILPLWPDQVPNERKSKLTEESEITDTKRIRQVRNPSIEVYLPTKSSATGKAVLICPGGGYGILAYDKEGTDFAKWLNGYGIAGIVLKYRLPEDDSNITPHLSPIMDAKQGMKLIRQNATKWNIDTDQVGVMGFSAGGHLAATLGTHYDEETRPDFMALIYPVITMKTDYTHMGSRTNLLGENPTPALIAEYSSELQVTADTPPTFIVHSQNDEAVPIENSLQMYKALRTHQVPTEMHLYPSGGHGYGFALNQPHLSSWSQRLADWLMLR